ncbi:MAG: hypothetical protein Q7U26_19595, partial [Aquabacterium sp.]|nr:hypothetical protein [Aquabacterium sp.]
MSAQRHRRRAAWVVTGLSICTAALAQADGRSLIGSARAVDREAALLQLGDKGLAEAADLQAVADRLADPVAAVRWNAIAALRKAGSVATPVLLARLADRRMSHHVGSYFAGCGRALFVPSEGELAAAVLAASPEADSDLLWHRFAEADGDSSRLLGASLEAARRPPPADLLRTVHRQPADRRDLMLRLADANEAQTIDALSAALDAAGNDRTWVLERGVAQVLARAGMAGRVAAAKALASSPFPEAWLATAAGRDGEPAQAIRAFDAAALSRRPSALMAIADALVQVPDDGRDAPTAVPAWLAGVAPAAMRAFLAQPAGASADEVERLARAAERIVPLAAWRADVIALLARMLVAAERDA